MAKKTEFLEDRALKLYTEMLIEQLEQMEASGWKKPWVTSNNIKGGPQNINGRPYSGFNPILLMMVTEAKGYELPVFMTHRQANDLGLAIKKGSKGFPISFWNRSIRDKDGNKITEEEYERLSKEEQKQCKVFGFNKYFHVFNADQTDIREVKPELWEKIRERMYNHTDLKDESRMFKSPEMDWLLDNQKWLCPIRQVEGDSAYYVPGDDRIVVPLKAQFDDGESFYSTVLHEMAHSTGTEERLNRKDFNSSKYEDYAREELVAELSAALAAIDLGINKGIKDESKEYLKAWLNNMRETPQFLHSVIADTNRAVRMIRQNVITLEMREAVKNGALESIGNFIEEKKSEEENRIPTVKPGELNTPMRPKREEWESERQGNEEVEGEGRGRGQAAQTYYVPSFRISDAGRLDPLIDLYDAGMMNTMGDQAIAGETPEWIEMFIFAGTEMDLSGKQALVVRETDSHAAVLNDEPGNRYVDVYHKVDESFLRNMLRQWDVLNGVTASREVTDLAVRMAGEEVAAHPETERTVSLDDGVELQWRFNAGNGDIELGAGTGDGFENLYSRGVDLTKPLQATVDTLREFAGNDARIRQENTLYLKALAEGLNEGKMHFQDAAVKMEQDEVLPFRMTPRQAQVLLYPYLNDGLRRQDPAYDGSMEYEQWKSDKEKLQDNIAKADTLDGHRQENGDKWTLPNGDKVQWKYDPYTDSIGIGHDNGYLFVREMEFPVDNTRDIIRNLDDIRAAVTEHYSLGNSLLPDLADRINNGRMTFTEAGDVLQRTGHYPWNPSADEVKACLHDLLRPELQGNIPVGELAGRNPGWNLASKEGLDYRMDFSKADKGWVTVRSDQGEYGYLQETLPLGLLKEGEGDNTLDALKEKAVILAEWQASLRKTGRAVDYAGEWHVDHTREIVLPDFSVAGFERGVDDKGREAVFMGPVDGRGNVRPDLVRTTDELGLAATPAGQLADKAKVREFVTANAESLRRDNGEGQDLHVLRDYYSAKEKYPDAMLFFRNGYGDRYTAFMQDAEAIAGRNGLQTVRSGRAAGRDGEPLQVLQFTSSDMDKYLSQAVRNEQRVAILDLDPEIERMVKDLLADGRAQDEAAARAAQTAGEGTGQEPVYYASVAYLQGDTDTARLDELKEAGRWDELLAEAAEYDQGEAIDLKELHSNSEHYAGDSLLDENEHYAVVYNNSVGGTYDIQRKVPGSEVWEMMRRTEGDYLELQDNPDLVPLLAGKVEEGYKAAMDRPQVIELNGGERMDWRLEDVSHQEEFGKAAYEIQVGRQTAEGFRQEHSFDYNLLRTFDENLAAVKELLEEQQARQQAEGQDREPEIEFRQGRNRVEVFVNQAQLGTITYDREWRPERGADESLLQHPKVAGAVEDMRTRGNMMQYDKKCNSTLVALKPLNRDSLVHDNPKATARRTMLAVEEIDGQKVGVVEKPERDLTVIPDREEEPRAYIGLDSGSLKDALDGKDPHIRPATPEALAQADGRADRYLRAFEQRYWQALVFGDKELAERADYRLRCAMAYKHQGMDYGELSALTGQVRERVKETAKQDKWLRSPARDANDVFHVFVKTGDKKVFRPYSVLTDQLDTPKKAMQHSEEFYSKKETPYLAAYMQEKLKENGWQAFQLRGEKGKVYYDSRVGEGRIAQVSPEAGLLGVRDQAVVFEAAPDGRGMEVRIDNSPGVKPAGLFIHADRSVEKTANYPLTPRALNTIENFARRGNGINPADESRVIFPPAGKQARIYDNVLQLRNEPVSIEWIEGEYRAVTADREIVARGKEIDGLAVNSPENRQAVTDKANQYLKGYKRLILEAVLAEDDEEVGRQAENYVKVLRYRDQKGFDPVRAEEEVQDVVRGAKVERLDRALARDKEESMADRVSIFVMRDGHLGINEVKDKVRSATRRLSDADADTFMGRDGTMTPGELEEFKQRMADKYIRGRQAARLPEVSPEIRSRISEVTVKHMGDRQGYSVRARIDGEQQMFRPVSREHIRAYFDGLKGQPKEAVDERRAQLAAVCFRDELQAVRQDLGKGMHR